MQLPEKSSVVLVVDDDAVNLRVVQALMKKIGIEAVTASDGNEAAAIFREYHAMIGLVLLDVQLPGLDGPATLAVLRATDPAVKVCFMSADTGRYTKDDLLTLGAVGFLEKPITSEQLAALFGVRVSLDRRV
jgi:CheY-like chemotaxis protein